MSVASVIRDRRAALGLTLEEVANRVGVTKSTVRKWEHGLVQRIGVEKITRLASVLNVPVTELIEETELVEAIQESASPPDLDELVMKVNDDKMSPFILKGDEVYYTPDVEQIGDGDIIVVSVKKMVQVRYAYLTANGIKLHSGSHSVAPEFYPLKAETQSNSLINYVGLRILGLSTRLVRNLFKNTK